MLEQQILPEKIADEEKRVLRMPEISTQPLRLNINRAVKRAIICRVSDQSSDSGKNIPRNIHETWGGGGRIVSHRRPRYRFKLLRPWFVANRMLCTHVISGPHAGPHAVWSIRGVGHPSGPSKQRNFKCRLSLP